MFDAGAISAKITLDASAFNTTAKQVQSNVRDIGAEMQKFGQNIVQVGTQIGKLGSRFIMFGGMILAPLTLAMRQLSKENIIIKDKFDELNRTFSDFGNTLSGYIIPYLDKLIDTIKSIEKWFNNLSSSNKKLIVDFMVLSGVILIVVGTGLKLTQLILLLNGQLLIMGGFLLKAIPLLQIFSTFRFMGLTTDIIILIKNMGLAYPAILLVASAFAGWKIGEWIGKISGLNEALSGENGLFTKMFMWLDKHDLIGKMERFAVNIAKLSIKGLRLAVPILPEIKPTVDLGKIEIVREEKSLDTLKSKLDKFWTGFGIGAKEAIEDLANFGKLGADVAKNTAQAMSRFFEDLFFNVFTGQLRDIQQVFIDFGNNILRILAQVFSRIIMFYTIIKPLSGIFGVSTSVLGFQEGTDRIPYTGVYRLHEGEKVVPRYDSNREQAQRLTIYNMITPEAVAAAMSGKEGEGVIVNTINLNSLRNGVIRREVVKR